MDLGKEIGSRIGELIEQRGLDNQKTAKLLSKLRPGSTVEGFRRQIIRWRDGQIPEYEQAVLLAQVLEADVSELRPAEMTQAEADRLRAATERRGPHVAELERENQELKTALQKMREEGRETREQPKPGSRTRKGA